MWSAQAVERGGREFPAGDSVQGGKGAGLGPFSGSDLWNVFAPDVAFLSVCR